MDKPSLNHTQGDVIRYIAELEAELAEYKAWEAREAQELDIERAKVERLEKIEAAAKKRVDYGHDSEWCFPDEEGCTCGHDELAAAMGGEQDGD